MTAGNGSKFNPFINDINWPSNNKGSALLPFLLLPARLILFAVFQLVIAAIIRGDDVSLLIQQSAIYWPFSALGANIITILILWQVFKKEGITLAAIYKFTPGYVGKDILATLIIFIIAAPISLFPSTFLGKFLFSDPNVATSIMFAPMPLPIALLTILFPLTIAFAELPLYFGYILPRLSVRMKSSTGAAVIVGLFLALQHCSLPLVPDWNFMLWRFGMFLPLALWLAFTFVWRPRLLPYMMIGHALLDLATVAMIISSSTNPV